jgi:hypothetical protein
MLCRCDFRFCEKRGAGIGKTKRGKTKRGKTKRGKTKRGKGSKIMAIADASGLPVSVCTSNASPHEVTLVQQTLVQQTLDARFAGRPLRGRPA